MSNISKVRKKKVFSYQKETFNDNKIKESKPKENINTFGMQIKKDRLQKLILTKSLIVKL